LSEAGRNSATHTDGQTDEQWRHGEDIIAGRRTFSPLGLSTADVFPFGHFPRPNVSSSAFRVPRTFPPRPVTTYCQSQRQAWAEIPCNSKSKSRRRVLFKRNES